MSLLQYIQKIFQRANTSLNTDVVFFNTLSRKKERFSPLSSSLVKIYSCGPTVYSRSQIGNLRAFVIDDLLQRTLRFNGYSVHHVLNITDVGHLTDDADTGEDKLEQAAQKENKTAADIALHYTNLFF